MGMGLMCAKLLLLVAGICPLTTRTLSTLRHLHLTKEEAFFNFHDDQIALLEGQQSSTSNTDTKHVPFIQQIIQKSINQS
jgi:hypothetical protein